MPNEHSDFVDTIIQGFQSLRRRPHFDVLTEQFLSGDLTFVVDRKGIQVHLGEVASGAPDDTLG